MCRAVKDEHHKSVLGGKTREEGAGKKMVERSWKAGPAAGISAGIPRILLSAPHPCGDGELSSSSILFSTPPNARSPVFHKRGKQHAVNLREDIPMKMQEGKNSSLLRLSEHTRQLMSPGPPARSEWAFRREITLGKAVSGGMSSHDACSVECPPDPTAHHVCPVNRAKQKGQRGWLESKDTVNKQDTLFLSCTPKRAPIPQKPSHWRLLYS